MEQEQQQAGAEAPEQSAGTSESATGTNEGSESQEQEQQQGGGLTPEAQEIVNNAIGRQHKKFRDEQDRANTLEAENQRLRANLPQEQRPDIPEPPDSLDDNFEEKTRARDTAIREASAFDVRQDMARQQAVTADQTAQSARAETFNKAADTYMGRAAKLGLDATALQVAGNTVVAYGASEELVGHILHDDKGPLITQYLAGNLNELETLRAMPPMQAAVHLATVIVPKIPTVPATTGAPKPPDGLSGGGVPPAERGPDGTTYE